ncbi:MAG: cupin domain-containing protein [Gluconacetobacter diazotrophicus]|nr:cupin domain-containing protein [Gluconacetobacter diazotrophicus]
MTTEAHLPADDPSRPLTVTSVDGPGARHIALAGDIYTILVSGADTAGRYCLIDMHVLDGGGPGPHRHDFEELFQLIEGELEVTFRGETRLIRAPATINIPANAPHSFRNRSGRTAHMLCLCAPAGQDEFFLAIGTPVEGPQSPLPRLSPEEQDSRRRLALELAPAFRTEMLG